jgi:hypothetical protein
VRHELNEQMRTAPLEPEVPQLVNDQESRGAVEPESVGELALTFGFRERGRSAVALVKRTEWPASMTAQCNREVCLSTPGAPKIGTLSAWARKRSVSAAIRVP